MSHSRRAGYKRTDERTGSHGRGAAGVALALALVACSGGGETGTGGGGGGNRGGGHGKNMNVTPVVTVQNTTGLARTETVRVSIPFTEGAVTSLATIGVRGIGTAWLPLQRWPDGSVKVAQAQFTDALAAYETKTYQIVKDVTAASGPFEPHPWVGARGSQMHIGARVRDTFDVPYEAEIAGSAPEILQETYLVRVSRHRLYHRAAQGGMGRDFLSSTFYLTEFRDMPFVTVDWILGNDYLGIDDTTGQTDPNLFPLGTIDLNRAEFLVNGVEDAAPYLKAKHAISDIAFEQGWASFKVMENTYIDDGQTRRYRFNLRIEDLSASQQVLAAWRNTFNVYCNVPIYALVDQKAWQDTGALGLFGGPITGHPDAFPLAEREYFDWDGQTSRFGTWEDFGDVKETATTGTPRNAPISPELGHAIQAGYPNLLHVLEQKAWVQACRTYHLHGLEVGSEENVMLWDMPPVFPGSRDLSGQSFGRRAIWRGFDPYAAYRTRVEWNFNMRGHSFTPYDVEHMSVDLLFDYWSMSGDAWAKEELRLMGHCLKGTLRVKNAITAHAQAARAEGWSMMAFVQCWLASGDDSIKVHAVRRMREAVAPEAMRSHPSRCLTMQGPYPGTGFPGDHRFFMPWQHGAVLYGMLAADQFFEDDVALSLAEDVATAVEYAWVRNVQDPHFGFVADGLRYYAPVWQDGNWIAVTAYDATVGVKFGDSPLGGAHGFLTGGLYLLADRTQNTGVRDKSLQFADKLLWDLHASPSGRWYKWHLVVPEHLLP